MYPDPEILQEVGRITIAGSRLDIQMGYLWHHLDRGVDVEVARKAQGAQQCEKVRKLAGERLVGDLRDRVLAVVDDAETVRKERNEIVHQDWLLRGRDATRSVAEISKVDQADIPEYLEEWRRESKPSLDWRRVPARSTSVLAAQELPALIEIERRIGVVTDRVSDLVYTVASSRESGRPTGYLHPL